MRALQLLALLGLAGGCGDKSSKSEPTTKPSEGSGSSSAKEPDKPAKPDKPSPSAKDKLAKYQDCWKAFNEGKDEAFGECYALDAARGQVDSVPASKAQGRPKIVEMVKAQRVAFPDLKITPMLVVASGNDIAAILHVGGTNTGELGGLKPTKKAIGLFEAQLVTMGDDNLIATDSFYLDQLTIYHQLGLLENESSPNKVDKPADVKVSADPPADATKQTLDKFFTALNAKDLKGLEAIAADDIKFVAHGERTKIEGKKAYLKWLKDTLESSKDSKVTATGTWIAGQYAATAETFTGTSAKDLPGTKDTKGKPIESNYAQFFQVVDGKIKQQHMFTNHLNTAVQLGVVDPEQIQQLLSGQ